MRAPAWRAWSPGKKFISLPYVGVAEILGDDRGDGKNRCGDGRGRLMPSEGARLGTRSDLSTDGLARLCWKDSSSGSWRYGAAPVAMMPW